MRIPLLSLLSLFALLLACASPDGGKAKEKAALKEIADTIQYADSSLPPCEGLNQISSVVMKHSPPKSCPLASAFFESLSKLDIGVRQNCQDLSHWMEDEIRNFHKPTFSCTKNKQKLVAYKMSLLPNELEEELSKAADALNGVNFDEDSGSLTGEAVRFECRFAVNVGLQYRKRILAGANKHYSIADIASDSLCAEENNDEAKDYLAYLRGGEAAFTQEAERRPAGVR